MSLEAKVRAFREEMDLFIIAYHGLVVEKKKNRAPMARKSASEMSKMLKEIRVALQEYKERI